MIDEGVVAYSATVLGAVWVGATEDDSVTLSPVFPHPCKEIAVTFLTRNVEDTVVQDHTIRGFCITNNLTIHHVMDCFGERYALGFHMDNISKNIRSRNPYDIIFLLIPDCGISTTFYSYPHFFRPQAKKNMSQSVTDRAQKISYKNRVM